MYQIALCDDEGAIWAHIGCVLDEHPCRKDFAVTEFFSGEALLDSFRSGQIFSTDFRY